ncbi:MAG: 6-hydroxymethylpterin diphosphokinase MptE-like protein [Humidesulfovibrio sp.]
MNPKVLFSVLRELGVLFEAPGAGEISDLPPYEAPAGDIDHAFHAHTPLWAFEHPYYTYPFAHEGLKPVFELLPQNAGVEDVLAKTRLVVFLGAADTPVLRRCLEQPETFLLILEPDGRRLAQFAARVPAARLARRALILLGDPDAFLPPVSQVLPPELFTLGFPVFYSLPELAGSAQAARLVELVEVLFYRHRVYHLSGQANVYSLPIRPLARGLFFDQQQHSYVNAAEFLRWPDIRPLRGAFQGETAVLVAAGPDLAERLDYLRQVRGRALVIAVNNALKPMVAAGVRPHFVVANDTSVHTGRSWEGLPHLADVALVGHCLTDLGGTVFGRKYLFGTYLPELYGRRPDLRLHGSVITTAFSLARYMGCARCVFVGAQLCSPDPWKLSYSRGSIHEAEATPERKLTNAWPQLVPVTTLDGQTRYTTLNFLDAAHWLRDEIRASGIPCASVTGESVIAGPGVECVPDCPVADTGRLGRRLGRVAAAQAPEIACEPVLAHLRRDLQTWESVAAAVEGIQARQGADFLAAAAQALERFDQGNVTYLVQRFEDFDNQRFHAAVFKPGPEAEKARGLRYYLDHVGRMARHFAAVLKAQLARLG